MDTVRDGQPTAGATKTLTSIEYFDSRGFSEGFDLIYFDSPAKRDGFLQRLVRWKVPFIVLTTTHPVGEGIIDRNWYPNG